MISFMPWRNTCLPVLAIIAFPGPAQAFTASATVPTMRARSGSTAISGSTLSVVSFVSAPTTSTVKVSLAAAGDA